MVETEAFLRGKRAKLRGEDFSSNPYDYPTSKFWEWYDGWESVENR
jgi:hypothetical protein